MAYIAPGWRPSQRQATFTSVFPGPDRELKLTIKMQTQLMILNVEPQIQTAEGWELKVESECDWQLTLWVHHILFIMSHSPDCPAKETSARPSPQTRQLCSLNGRCFPVQRNREHITGNEGGGRSQLPSSGLEWASPGKQATRRGHMRDKQILVGKTKWRVNRVKWFHPSN